MTCSYSEKQNAMNPPTPVGISYMKRYIGWIFIRNLKCRQKNHSIICIFT